jgi:hypothetical protein
MDSRFRGNDVVTVWLPFIQRDGANPPPIPFIAELICSCLGVSDRLPTLPDVIPANAGIHFRLVLRLPRIRQGRKRAWGRRNGQSTMDSRFRGNDVAVFRLASSGGRAVAPFRPPGTFPRRAGEGTACAIEIRGHLIAVIPAGAEALHNSEADQSIEADIPSSSHWRHSRESGNPFLDWKPQWIPAFAGMTSI